MSSHFSSNCEFNQRIQENSSNIAYLANPLQTSLDTHLNNSTNKSYQIQYENISPNMNNQQMTMEKEKLFQEFLIFQNFMKMQNLMKNNPPSEISFVNFENLNKHHSDKQPNKKQENNEIENTIKLAITQSYRDTSKDNIKTEEKVEEKKDKIISVDNQQLIINNKEGNSIKFDDIPIKPNSHNFIELLEKQLNNNSYKLKPEPEQSCKTNTRYKSNNTKRKNKKENKIVQEKVNNNDKEEGKFDKLNPKDEKETERINNNLDTNSALKKDNYKNIKKADNMAKDTLVAKSLDLRNEQLSRGNSQFHNNEKNLEKSYSLTSKKDNYSKTLLKSEKNSPIKEVKMEQTNVLEINNNNNINILTHSNRKNGEVIIEQSQDKNNERSSAYKTKKEYEKLIENLMQERKLFNEQKIKEKKEFENWKASEIQKLRSKNKTNNSQEITSYKNKIQLYKDKEKQYLSTIENLKKDILQQQNLILSLNSKVKHYEDLLKIDNIGIKINTKKNQNFLEKEKFLLNDNYDDIKLKEVKSVRIDLVNNKNSTEYEEEKEIINYDEIGKEDNIIDENSLSDIDEKRSFDDKSIQIRNHVPHINKINIVQFPKKSLKVNHSRTFKNDDMKVDFLSLNKNEEINVNLNSQQDTQRFKRTGTTTNILSSNKSKEKLSEKADSEISCSWDIKFPDKYHNSLQQNCKIIKHEKGTEGKVYLLYENGKKEVIFPNGIRKIIFDDGYSIIYLNNKDIKQTFPDGKVVYYFYKDKITQTSFKNGLKVVKFHNGQIEKYFPDGNKEITFPDGTTKIIKPMNDK